MRTTSSTSGLELDWRVIAAPWRGHWHLVHVVHEGRAVGSLRLACPGDGLEAVDAWPNRVWKNGRYAQDFYEWFYEGWYVTLMQPPLLVEAIEFDLDLDPTLGLESHAVLEAMAKIATPGSAVVGPALELVPADQRAHAKAGGLVAWASHVSARVYGGACIVAAADDVARASRATKGPRADGTHLARTREGHRPPFRHPRRDSNTGPSA